MELLAVLWDDQLHSWTVSHQLLMYLVCYYRPACGSGVCRNNNAAIVETANNGRTGAGRFRKRYTLCMEGEVSVVVGKVKARHCESMSELFRGWLSVALGERRRKLLSPADTGQDDLIKVAQLYNCSRQVWML